MSQNDHYEVGYGKPPKASRGRKGQSGNRRGRQKGARNLKTELSEELAEIISIKENLRGTVSCFRRPLHSEALRTFLKLLGTDFVDLGRLPVARPDWERTQSSLMTQ